MFCLCLTLILACQLRPKKPLKLDSKRVQDSHRKIKITNIAFIPSEYNIADLLTKVKSHLKTVLLTCRLNHPVQQPVNQEELPYDSVLEKWECGDMN